MQASKKDQICALLKAIETGDPAAVAVVNEGQYIQHNPSLARGTSRTAYQPCVKCYPVLKRQENTKRFIDCLPKGVLCSVLARAASIAITFRFMIFSGLPMRKLSSTGIPLILCRRAANG
jgi:hypothetical protein